MNSPKVSVLIPTYNSAQYLEEAIESVLAQTFKNFELIIMDDASTDDTREKVKPYLRDQRVSYHRNSSNLGLPGNWNKCLSIAKGSYIKFLMSDDTFYPTLLEKFIAIFDTYPTVSIVTSYKNCIDSSGRVIKKLCQPFTHLQDGKKIICESLRSFNIIGEPTTVMFRKENLHLGEFNVNYKWIPDWDMWLRHLTIGDCYIIPEILSTFRHHESQSTAILSKNLRRQNEEYLFYKAIEKSNPYEINLDHIQIENILKIKSYKYIRSSIKHLVQLKKSGWLNFNTAAKNYIIERLP